MAGTGEGGKEVYDQDLYGGGGDQDAYDLAIGDEQEDEREQLVARCVGTVCEAGGAGGRQRGFGLEAARDAGARRRCERAPRRQRSAASSLTNPVLLCVPCSKLASYTAPKSVMGDLPTEDGGDQVRGGREKRAAL